MDSFGIVTAVFFALVGLLLVLFLLRVLVEAVVGDRRSFTDRLRFKQKERLIKSADTLIAQNAFADACVVLRKAFFLEQLRADAELIDKISNHHISVLSRLVLIADKHSRQIPNLAVIEDLLLSRAEMLRASLEAKRNVGSLLKRRRKETPQWAVEEYSKKLSEIRDKLQTNRRSLDGQLRDLFSALLETQQEPQVTYH